MSDSTSKRLEDHPTHSDAGRDQTEMAALAAVTGLSGDKANEYYHQVLGARGAKPADNLVDGDENDWHADDFYNPSATNLGNTKIARSGRKPKGSSGKNVEPIQVFEKGKDPKAFDDAKKAMTASPSTEITAQQVEMSPDDVVKAQMNRSGTAGGNRSFSDSDTGVVYAARPEALEEELSHQLNPADARKTTAENKRADKAQADALARAKGLGLGRDEAYYVFGKRGERVNAMAMAKHVVMRARKDLVPLLAEQGEGAVDAFVAEVEREMRADGRPDDIKPVLAVVRAYAKLSQMKPSEMTPEQREAWKDLSDAGVWDQVAKAEGADDESSAGKEVMADAKGGDAGGEVTENAEIVNSGEAADTPVTNGPRIVVNPKVFRDSRDALCVAYNEAYRVAMEGLGFDPVSEPTDEQRRFFADTAYADDERMMRRTILARVCTFDTSVKNPTDEQIQESVEFLETVLEAGFPQNEREQSVVKRTLDVLRSVPQGRGDAVPAEEGAPEEGVPGEAGASGDGAPLDEPPG